MKHYKMMVTVKGSVIYKILLENDETENDIVKETLKRVVDEYNYSGSLIDWDTTPDIVKGEHDDEYYVFENVHFACEIYVSIGENDDFYVKTIEKFREEVPGIHNIKEMKVEILELLNFTMSF